MDGKTERGGSISAAEIRKNIKRELKRRGISQRRLAEMTAYPESTVSKTLAGDRGLLIEDLIAFADALQVPVSSLVTLKGDMDGKTLADACRALVTLDRILGLNISMGPDDRPQVSFRYSGLDGFLKFYRGLAEAAEDLGPENAAVSLNALIEKNKEKPVSVYSEKGSRAGRAVFGRLGFLLPPSETQTAAAPQNPEEIEKANARAAEKAEALVKKIRPQFTRTECRQLREWIADARRRQAWQEIRQAVPPELVPLPPDSSPGSDVAFVEAWAEILNEPRPKK